MKEVPVSARFMLEQPELSWQEIKWGLDRGWIRESVVIDLAVAQLLANENQPPEVLELASLSSKQHCEVPRILDRLSQSANRPDANRPSPKHVWLRIILAWILENRDKVADPLGAVEELYADFDYPPEIAGFVRYMPPDDDYNPQAHSEEENIDRLYRRWRQFLDG